MIDGLGSGAGEMDLQGINQFGALHHPLRAESPALLICGDFILPQIHLVIHLQLLALPPPSQHRSRGWAVFGCWCWTPQILLCVPAPSSHLSWVFSMASTGSRNSQISLPWAPGGASIPISQPVLGPLKGTTTFCSLSSCQFIFTDPELLKSHPQTLRM